MARLDETITAGQAGHISDSQVLARKANYIFDVMDYGAAGDGVTDDSTEIQNAIDAAELVTPTGTVYFPSRQFKIDTGIVVLDCSVYAESGAQLLVDDTVAAGITIGSASASCDYHNLMLPSVVRESYDWDSTPTIGTNRGVVFKAADGCVVTVREIGKFSYGLVLEGDGNGVAYNTFILMFLSDNATNLYLEHINNGWTNQNTFIGGRLHISDIGGTPPYAGTRQILIGSNKVETNLHPNGNLFLGTSIESDNDEFKIECWGSYNKWVDCRYEGVAAPKIAWRAYDATRYAHSNVIDGGWASEDIIITSDSLSRYNNVLAPRQSRIQGGDSDGIIAMSNRSSDTFGIKLFKGADPIGDKTIATDYQVNIGAAVVSMKAETDSFDRFYLNTVLGRLYMGTGAADPTATANGYLRFASGLWEFNGVGLRIESAGTIRSGSGTPEANVTSPVGSLYMRTDGGANTSLYVKELGTGSTGWVAK